MRSDKVPPDRPPPAAPAPDRSRILLGHIVAAHGIRGEVLVRTYTGAPADITAYGPLTSADGSRSFRLAVVRETPKGVIARVGGIADRTAAEALAGVALYVPRHLLPAPADSEFYHADLVGLAAVAPDGTAVGDVVAVQNYGAGDLLEIRLAATGRTELVPFADAYVPIIDVETGRLVVVMPAAAEDDDAPS